MLARALTYTATVTPPPSRPGPVEPTGAVEFFDGGHPIASCLSQALTNAGATCTVAYKTPGRHTITAQYGGDASFSGSVALGQPVNVVRVPPRVLGVITATMQWSFYYTPSYTTVRALVVNGAAGAAALVKCHGRGCPFAKHAVLVTNSTRCGLKSTHSCPTYGKIDLTRRFRKGHLRVGARITVVIRRPGWIGKYCTFTVRAGRGPLVPDRLPCTRRHPPRRRLLVHRLGFSW